MLEEQDTFYDRMAAGSSWDEWTNPYETRRRLHAIFERLLPPERLAGQRFLDAGSGGGHFSAAAHRAGARVTSLDVGANLLAEVTARVAVGPVQGSVTMLPFRDASFDVVLSTEVVEHTPDPRRCLGELARVVKPGGTLVVTTPGRLWQPVVRLASRLQLRPYQGRENFLWPHTARRTVEHAGIEVDRLFGFNLLPLFHEAFDGFHRAADRLGTALPWLYVNFAIRGTKASL